MAKLRAERKLNPPVEVEDIASSEEMLATIAVILQEQVDEINRKGR